MSGNAAKMAYLAAKRRELVNAKAKAATAESVMTTKERNLMTAVALKEAEVQAVAACSIRHQDTAFAVQALIAAQKKISLKEASQKLMDNSAVNNDANANNFYSVIQASGGAHELAAEATASRALKKKMSAHKDSQSEEIMTRERAELEDLKKKAQITKKQEIIAERRAADATLAFRTQMEKAEKMKLNLTEIEIRAERFKKANEVAAAIVKARELLYAENVTSNPAENVGVEAINAKEKQLREREQLREKKLAEEALAMHLATVPKEIAVELVTAADSYKSQMKIQSDFAESHRIERERAMKETNRLLQEKLDRETADNNEAKSLQLSTAEARKAAAKANLKRMNRTLDIADAKNLNDEKNLNLVQLQEAAKKI